jgi:hypothetical protein
MLAYAAQLKVLGFAIVLGIPALGGCAVLPAPDYRAALVKTCETGSDDYPWAITDNWSDGDKYLPDAQFRADGVMLYAYDGSEFDNAKWTLDGASLFIEMNNRYAEYSATFDGASASGSMKNEAGNKGTWTLTRACK